MVNNDGLTPDTNVSFINDAWVVTEDLDDTGSGDSVLTSTSWYTPPGTADDWIISPAITLGAFGNKMSFDAKTYDASFADGFQVFASQFNAIDSFLVHDTLLDITAQNTSWTTYEISLDSFALSGQTIYLAFRNNSSDDYLLSLDNIYVGKEHPVSVREEKAEEFGFYPNPVMEVLQITNWNSDAIYEVLSSDGKLLKTITQTQLDASVLDSGVYLIRETLGTRILVKQFVKL